MTRTPINQAGITIVELLVVITVSLVLMTVTTAFALDYWGTGATLQSDEQTLVSRLNAGDYIRQAVDSSSGLVMQNDIADAHTGNADPSDGTGQYWLTIHAIPGTISMGAAGTITPLVYMERPSLDASKNNIMNGDIPYQDNVILYLNGTTKQLLARTLANPYAPANAAKTTCPPELASASCPPDTVVADNVSGVTMRYFSRSGNPIDYTSITDSLTGEYIGPDFPSVEVVEMKLLLSQQHSLATSQNTSNQTIIRVALRN